MFLVSLVKVRLIINLIKVNTKINNGRTNLYLQNALNSSLFSSKTSRTSLCALGFTRNTNSSSHLGFRVRFLVLVSTESCTSSPIMFT